MPNPVARGGWCRLWHYELTIVAESGSARRMEKAGVSVPDKLGRIRSHEADGKKRALAYLTNSVEPGRARRMEKKRRKAGESSG